MYRKFIMIMLVAVIIFTTASGQKISSCKVTELKQVIDSTDAVLVVSFWATFCKPCVEEIPYLESISKKYREQKVKVILVSIDLPDFYPFKIDSFIKKNNYTSEVIWLNENNPGYYCPKIDKAWIGEIPATYIVNNKKQYKKFIGEQMKPEQFEAELQKAF